MSWLYEQGTGTIFHDDTPTAVGYSGNGAGKNNPDMQDVHNVGPIPRGVYTIEAPVDTKTHGPYVLWLIPDDGNEMHGRSAFGIHGDSLVNPGGASEGCVILPKAVRVSIWDSGDRRFEVI